MNRSALLIALVVAGLGVFLLILYQHRFETEASGGDRIKLVIAVKPILRGTVVTERRRRGGVDGVRVVRGCQQVIHPPYKIPQLQGGRPTGPRITRIT